MEEVMYQELKSEKIKERMHNGLLEVGYTEKQIKKYLANGLTEEEYERLIEVHTEKTSTDKEGYVKFTYVNHSERADKFGRISDGNTTKYMNIALKYFSDRCALSGEKFEGFEKVKNSKVKSNLSAEHIVALCQGGDDVYPNLVPTVLQYNVSKNGYYLLDWWNKQKDTAGNNLYSSYRLLKLVNFMMKSLDARKQNLSLKQYENAILTYNEIDEFLAEIEKQDSQETDNSKRKLISDIKTTTEVDEDGKKFLQTIPEIEGDIPKQSEQQRKKNDDKMMDIFLYDSIKMLKEDEKLSQHTEFNQLMDCLDKMFIKARDVIPFEVKVRNKILNKIEELGVKENKYTVANALLQNTEILNIVKENSYEIDKYISQHFEEKEKQLIEKLGLTDKQIQIAVANIPEILYDESVIKKVYFYKENRLDHLQDYLEGKNNVTDKFIDNFIMLQSIGVDTNKLVVSDSIESLAKKSGISVDQLIEVGLNPSENIGTNKNSIIQAYRGKGNITPPTKEQAEELGNLGISLEERDVTQEFIDKINKLQSMGVDTNKLVQSDTIESLAKKSGISVEQLIEVGLNPSENIGTNKDRITQAYRGNSKRVSPTKEQVEELGNLGISLEKLKKDVTQEFIDKIKKLQSIGVDTNKLVRNDTIESLAKKSGISVEQLIEVGLNSSENIGTSKNRIVQAYRGNSQRVSPTKEQVKELGNLGISLEERDVTQEFIDKIKKLQSIGVDTNKLADKDTIESLVKKSGISVEQLIEVGLNPSEKIGQSKSRIAQAYRGKGNITPPTKEQAEELKNLRISLEERDVTQEFIDKIKKLQSIGADTNKLVKSDTIESLAKKSGISVEQLIEVGLNPSENIGTSKNNIAKAYRGNSKRVPPTKEQAEELENLGISLEKKVTREKIKTVISEQKQAGKIEENSKIDETFNENFRNAESSKIKEHGVR